MKNKECFMYKPNANDICGCLRRTAAKDFHQNDDQSDCPFAKTKEQQLKEEEYCKNRLLRCGYTYKSCVTGKVYK